MSYDNRHSLLVAWAKIALPLAALALLSTLFLFSGRTDPTQASLYAKVDVATMAREQRLTAPEYSGVTDDGSSLTVRAKTAKPGTDGLQGASAEDVIGKLEAKSGLVVDMTAKAGVLDPTSGLIRLSDGVALQTSTGYRMKTAKIDMTTDRAKITAPGQVDGDGPFGTITSGSMELSRPAPDAAYDLVFNGGVKLIYQPQ
ncbi:MAG: hypothetical protein AB7U46_00360 [Paenirhodobacter sp.]|uniref:hypothetical protein n=1 Tax=Paenirhodobacter sp. TaxID=1965326 RepID=UPI003D13569F